MRTGLLGLVIASVIVAPGSGAPPDGTQGPLVSPLAVGGTLVGLRLPFPADAAHGAIDTSGRLHVVFAHRERVHYTRRPAGSTQFDGPVVLPTREAPSVGGERRPRIAVGPDGRLVVQWQTHRGMTVMTSHDGGRTWREVSTRGLHARGDIDMPTLSVATDGRIHLVWVDAREGKNPVDEVSQHLYLATSADGGRSFGPPRSITRQAPRACPCCMPAIATSGRGDVWIAYRTSVRNIKEIGLLGSHDGGRTFAFRGISRHRWYFPGCPMAGPALAVEGGRLAVAWTSHGDMFVAHSSDGGRSLGTPRRLGRGRFVALAAAQRGLMLLVWDEGPQLGRWWWGRPRPEPRADIVPRGTLIAGPGDKFELLQTE